MVFLLQSVFKATTVANSRISPRSIGITVIMSMIILLSLYGCFRIFSKWQQTNCEARDTQQPNYPIFPGSIFLGQITIMDESWGASLSYNYRADDTFDNVVAHFRNTSNCSPHVFDGQMRCTGNATPFGEYAILIEQGSQFNKTTYSVDVRWDRCPSDWTIRVG